MDARLFDALTRTLAAPGSRRGLLARIASLPILGSLAAIDPSPPDADAARRSTRSVPKGPVGTVAPRRIGARRTVSAAPGAAARRRMAAAAAAVSGPAKPAQKTSSAARSALAPLARTGSVQEASRAISPAARSAVLRDRLA
jgi:hypothetical protein